MKPILAVVVLSLSLVVGVPIARSQIISTSLPALRSGSEKLPITAHFMVSPAGSWDYKEGWFSAVAIPTLSPTYNEYFVGTVGKTSTSQILAAGEAAIPVSGHRWTVTLGGWYNRIGDVKYDFDGQYLNSAIPPSFLDFRDTLKATIPMSVTIVEGHAGLYYGSFGVQVGVVRSSLKSNGDILNIHLSNGAPAADLVNYAPFEASTTDLTLYGVYKRSISLLGFSAGAGAYRKQGIKSSNVSPLRFAESKIVASGFLTANVRAWRGLSLDTSYWFIGKTDQAKDLNGYSSTTPSDSQSRLILGLGYSF